MQQLTTKELDFLKGLPDDFRLYMKDNEGWTYPIVEITVEHHDKVVIFKGG